MSKKNAKIVRNIFESYQIRDFIHKENMVGFLTVFINKNKIDETTAISLNTAILLDKLNDIVKNSEHINI